MSTADPKLLLDPNKSKLVSRGSSVGASIFCENLKLPLSVPLTNTYIAPSLSVGWLTRTTVLFLLTAITCPKLSSLDVDVVLISFAVL